MRRIDPAWIEAAHNLGAGRRHMLTTVILPAVDTDILTGIRLALGVASVVLVPGEHLGVASGRGDASNDARHTLDYARLSATVVVMGAVYPDLDIAWQKAVAQLASIRSA